MHVLADRGCFNISGDFALVAHLLTAESATALVFPLGLGIQVKCSSRESLRGSGCMMSPLALLLECSGQDKWCYLTVLCSPLSPAQWVMVWVITHVLVIDLSWQGSTFGAGCGERQ